MKVLGIDPSMTGTGLALYHDKSWAFRTIKTSKEGEGYRDQNRRFYDINKQIKDILKEQKPDIVVMEGPSMHSQGNAIVQIFGLWWSLYDTISSKGSTIYIVPPANLKVFATGKGTAGKLDMKKAMDMSLGRGIGAHNNNEVDALWLAMAGLTTVMDIDTITCGGNRGRMMAARMRTFQA